MKHWTGTTDIDAVAFFDGLPVKEIRHRQELCELQLQMCDRMTPLDAVADLQAMQDALMESMLRRSL